MTYFFILGNNTTLSLMEISSYFSENLDFRLISKNVLLIDTDKDLEIDKALNHLGGTIKTGVIFDTSASLKAEFIVNKVRNILNPGSNKFKFGFSFYGNREVNLKPIGMEVKKLLKEKNVSCRWVTSKEKTLSSVVVEQNKLINEGIEISIFEDSGKYHLGKTLAVQPFKSLSFRDYGRPARDDHSGMLPPKLAQIMINLAHVKKDDLILDAFCGSGTILTEALLMGYTNIVGSDISTKAIQDTQENINWIKKNYELKTADPRLNLLSATEVSKSLEPHSVSAIISEPFLGEQRGKIDIKKQISDIEKLYSASLKEFKKVLKPAGVIIMLFPVFFGKYQINPNLDGYKIISLLPKNFQKNKFISLTARQTAVYGRIGQRVFREIVVLKKS
jgi:tRNA G10  N-methylase Trm11